MGESNILNSKFALASQLQSVFFASSSFIQKSGSEQVLSAKANSKQPPGENRTPQPARSGSSNSGRYHRNSRRKFKRSLTLASIPDQLLSAAAATAANSQAKSTPTESGSKTVGKKKKKRVKPLPEVG